MATASQTQMVLLTLSNQMCAWISRREVKDSGIRSLYNNLVARWNWRIQIFKYNYFKYLHKIYGANVDNKLNIPQACFRIQFPPFFFRLSKYQDPHSTSVGGDNASIRCLTSWRKEKKKKRNHLVSVKRALEDDVSVSASNLKRICHIFFRLCYGNSITSKFKFPMYVYVNIHKCDAFYLDINYHLIVVTTN